jgi:hypothetical protein
VTTDHGLFLFVFFEKDDKWYFLKKEKKKKKKGGILREVMQIHIFLR